MMTMTKYFELHVLISLRLHTIALFTHQVEIYVNNTLLNNWWHLILEVLSCFQPT